jgi:hypothetical protein
VTTLRGVASIEDAYLAALGDMPETYLECRSTQHRMNVTDSFRIVDTRTEKGARPHMGHTLYAKRVCTCDRCGMVRNDFYAISSRRGHNYLTKINATYEPPEGYSVPGLGRVEGSRGLALGLGLDIGETQVRGRGRPRAERR